MRRGSAWFVALGASIGISVGFHSSTVTAQLQSTPLPLVQEGDLTYVGAFRTPTLTGPDVETYNYGGSILTYNPVHNSLFLAGFTVANKVGEFTIPNVLASPTISGLARATTIQPLSDPLAGKRLTVDGDISNGVNIGGILPFGNNLIVSEYTYYDGNGTQSLSHFKTGTDFANPGPVVGPVQVKTTLHPNGPGFTAGWMADIPWEWQAALGGKALTGQCCLAITTRSSYGPSLSVFNPGDVGLVSPVPSTPVLGYPSTHQTLGTYGPTGNSAFYNGKMDLGGYIFPSGTSSVLFWGRRGTRFCYGDGTSNASLDLQPVSGQPGVIWCYDPTDSSKGTHGYPYEDFVAGYDANDLVRVKYGQKWPWEIFPYAKWTFRLPYETTSTRLSISGVTYDPTTHRVFVAAGYQDGTAPIIHVFSLNPGSSGPVIKHLCF